MKIEHTWENAEGQEMGWAVPSRREMAKARKSGRDVMEVCVPPRGWADAGEPDEGDGMYVIRDTTRFPFTW